MNKHLQQYIKYCEEFYNNSFMILLDRDLIARFVGNEYLKVGNKTRESIIGKQVHQTAPVPPENIEPSFKAFNKAITENKIVPVLIANLLHKTTDMIQIFGAHIYPVTEPGTNFVIALRFEFYKVKLELFFQALINNVNKIKDNGLPHNDDFLTKREHQIAFLLFYCKDYVEIAQIISIFNNSVVTEKTVRNIVSRYLYPKFMVSNKENLIAKLQQCGYDSKMPNSLLTNRFIDLSS